jgi:hypothetical protein
MSIENWLAPDEMSCDACLLGMGAISKNQFFHRVFPEFLREKNLHINCLELLTISIAMNIIWYISKYPMITCTIFGKISA